MFLARTGRCPSRGALAGALAVLLAGAPSVDLAAQSTTVNLATASLEELMNVKVTTATRTSEALADAPARMQVVTADQIRRRGYRSLLDVLEDLPDFKIDRSGDPDYPSQLTVQGSRGANYLIVLLDGIRISAPTNEPLPILSNYPVHTAKQIEIVYGPASAVYGADAFSGVINIISAIGDEPGVSVRSAAGQYGLYDNAVSFSRRVGGGNLLAAGQFTYDRQPDLSRFYPEVFNRMQAQRSGVFESIFGPMSPSRPVSPDYEAPISTYSLQAGYQLHGLQLALFANRSKFSTAPPYTPDNAVYDKDAFTDNRLLVASGTYTHLFGPVTSTSTLTFSRHEMDPGTGYWNVFSNFERSYKYAYGSMLKADQRAAWKPSRAFTLTAGGTVERFFAIPQGADLNAPLASRDEPGTILGTTVVDELVQLRYRNVGGYAQVHYEPSTRAAIILGARADHSSRYGSTFNPRAGLVLKPAAQTTLKVMYGTAFLAPSPYEAYLHYGSFYSTDGGQTYASDYWHLPNPDLKPQKKKTIEVNLIRGLGKSFVASGSLFYSRFTDLLHPNDPDQAHPGAFQGWPVAYIDFAVNEGRATTHGGTIGLDYARSFGGAAAVAIRGAVSVVDGHGTRDGAHEIAAGGFAPVRAQVGADIDWGKWSVAPRVGITGAQRALATIVVGDRVAHPTIDGYSVTTVTARRRQVFKQLDLFLTVENAFDARYRQVNTRAFSNPEELVGAPQNPRRVVIGVDVRVR
jgi:outer membrane cobalamin receptor